MSSPAIIALAIVPDLPAPSAPANKRRITPSAELSTPKRAQIRVPPSQQPVDFTANGRLSITPFFAPKQLFPQAAARVVHEYTHAHPIPTTTEPAEEPTLTDTRHILLPFNLRDKKVHLLKGEVCDMLLNIFPDTTAVGEGRNRSYLHFTVSEMPKTPWPLTIGGLPFTMSDGMHGRGPLFPRQNLGNLVISICKDFNARKDDFSDRDLRLLAAEVVKELPDLNLIEVIFSFDRSFYVVLGDEVNINAIKFRLPGKIANCTAGYLNEEELHRPAWVDLKANRFIEPRPMAGVVDNTAYDVIRPGVMICGTKYRDHGHPALLSSTSGVLVKNVVGDVFITGASHGIGEDEAVYQLLPMGQKKVLGKAVQEISFTDISLVQLEEDISFVNDTFENYSGVVPKFTRLVGEILGELEEMEIYGVYLNSPYTGNVEGSVIMKSVRIEKPVSQHSTAERLNYVLYVWTYLGQVEGAGQDKFEPPDGTCGSTIWDDDGVVIGFFHYYITEGRWAGYCASVAASEVVQAGYRLA